MANARQFFDYVEFVGPGEVDLTGMKVEMEWGDHPSNRYTEYDRGTVERCYEDEHGNFFVFVDCETREHAIKLTKNRMYTGADPKWTVWVMTPGDTSADGYLGSFEVLDHA